MTIRKIKSELRAYSDPKRKAFSPSFFKTGKGEYGEGDKFIGVTAPNIREIAKKYNDIDKKDIQKLLYSPWHEERFCAWVIVISRYEKSEDKGYWYRFAVNNISQLLESHKYSQWQCSPLALSFQQRHRLPVL